MTDAVVGRSGERTKKQAGGSNASVGVTASTFTGETRMAWILGEKITPAFYRNILGINRSLVEG
jgi:hypothetical protein